MAGKCRNALLFVFYILCGHSIQAQTASHISIYFAGDVMQHKAQLDAAATSHGTYDYSGCFTQVEPEIQAATIAVCNLETTLGGPPYTGYPQFCSPDELAQTLQDVGFDIFLTANNHCLDRRSRGLIRTLDILDSLGIEHLGTYRNQAERDSLYPYIIEYETSKIALLNYTYDTNGIPVASPCIVNYIDTTIIKADIQKARALGAACIIACMHWGTEYKTQPDARQKQLERWLYANGVSHIIGGHPHVVQPVRTLPHEHYADTHLTAWSLGNYISNMSATGTDHGLAVTLHLLPIGSSLRLMGYDLHPNRTTRGSFTITPLISIQ